jgi:hypothetical protein
MTDTQREALALLAEIWELAPDLRFGQLMANLGDFAEVLFDESLGYKSLGYIDDDELLVAMKRHRDDLRARLQVAIEESQPEASAGET